MRTFNPAWRVDASDSESSRSRTRGPGTPVGPRYPIHHGSHRRACACDQASFSADDVLEHLAVERWVSDQLAQLGVLVLELLQPPHLRRRQPFILFLPIEVGCLAHASLAAD